MATKTRSHTGESSETFSQQNLLKNPEKEICAFDNADIAALRASGAFPDKAIIVRPIKALHVPDLCIEDIPIAYLLRSHGSSRFLLFSTSSNPLVLKATKNKDIWQRKFFFVRRDSITEGNSHPVKWPTSSKPTAIPKPYSATKTRASSSRKRKETNSPATSETFPYENHGFVEANGFMTSFLNQGLKCLVHLYEESCGLNKILEVKLKKAEVTITDQGMIATSISTMRTSSER
ncbi:hypothetical protein Hanom_Chr16g01491791 [Helianthus anomalus]